MALPANSHPYLRPIPGDKTRRVVDTRTGEILSRRAYQKALHGVSPERKAAATRTENAARRIPAWKLRYDAARMAYAKKTGQTTGQVRMDKTFQMLYKRLEKQRLQIIRELHPNVKIRAHDTGSPDRIITGVRTSGGGGGGGGGGGEAEHGEILDLGSNLAIEIAIETQNGMTQFQKDMVFQPYMETLAALGMELSNDWIYNFL